MKYNVILNKATPSKSFTVPFNADTIICSNPTASTIYLRQGALDIPTANNFDRAIPAASLVTLPVLGSSFAVAYADTTVIGTSANPQQTATIEFDKDEKPAQIGSVQPVARPQFYDRNPGSILIDYSATGVAPHALTVRSTYTVPVARKAYLESGEMKLNRGTRPTGVLAPIRGWIKGVVSANAGTILTLVLLTSAKYKSTQASLSSQITMLPGDSITLETQDTNTGGTADLDLSAKLMEYDL